ncbi:MAG: hypothetical protein AAGI17_03825 [Planctomycetota bacterium]
MSEGSKVQVMVCPSSGGGSTAAQEIAFRVIETEHLSECVQAAGAPLRADSCSFAKGEVNAIVAAWRLIRSQDRAVVQTEVDLSDAEMAALRALSFRGMSPN